MSLSEFQSPTGSTSHLDAEIQKLGKEAMHYSGTLKARHFPGNNPRNLPAEDGSWKETAKEPPFPRKSPRNLAWNRNGIDPLLGGTQTWKLSHWRFIKNDEKERENTLYVCRLSIPYNHLFVKKDLFLSVLLVFQSILDSDIPKKNVIAFDCKTLRCSQRWLFLPLFCSER